MRTPRSVWPTELAFYILGSAMLFLATIEPALRTSNTSIWRRVGFFLIRGEESSFARACLVVALLSQCCRATAGRRSSQSGCSGRAGDKESDSSFAAGAFHRPRRL